jgi:hypothetical protein
LTFESLGLKIQFRGIPPISTNIRIKKMIIFRLISTGEYNGGLLIQENDN